MIKWLSNILTRAGLVKNETISLANTALRVGSLLEDLSKATPMKWDAEVAYEAGQVAYFNDIRVEAVSSTNAGESPETHPLKWSKKIVSDSAQITSSNHLPVSASAVHAAIQAIEPNEGGTVPNATETQAGKIGIGTDTEVDEGTRDDVALTPKKLKNYFTKFFLNLSQATFNFVVLTLTQGPTSSAPNAPDELPRILFRKKVANVLQDFFDLATQSDNTLSAKLLGSEILRAGEKALSFFSELTSFSGFLRSRYLGIIDPPDISDPDGIAGFRNANSTGSQEVGRVSLSNLKKYLKLPNLLDGTAELYIKSQKQKDLTIVSGVPQFILVPVADTTGWTSAAMPISEFIRDAILPGLPTGSTGGTTNELYELTGCREVPRRPSPTEDFDWERLPLQVPVSHNLQTTKANIGLLDAWTKVPGSEDFWRKDPLLENLLEFPDEDHVQLSAQAAGYDNLHIKFTLKRMIPIPEETE